MTQKEQGCLLLEDSKYTIKSYLILTYGENSIWVIFGNAAASVYAKPLWQVDM